MAIYRMQLDDFDPIDYLIIAIHSSLEDYRMAYFLNQNLPILLEKNNQKIVIKSKNGNSFYSKFIFDDLEKDMIWQLIQNKNEIVSATNNKIQNLFFDEKIEVEIKAFLLPEYKNIDYILKIDNAPYGFALEQIIQKISEIDEVLTVYEIDKNTIKSKNNLIF